MGIRRYNLLIAVTVFAAVVSQIGCGAHNSTDLPIRRDVPPKVNGAGKKAGVGVGTTSPGTGVGTTSPGAGAKEDPGYSATVKDEGALAKSGQSMEKLTDGDYTLSEVDTYGTVINTHKGENAAAIQESKPSSNGNNQWSLKVASSEQGGTLSNFSDAGRDFDLPVTFSVKTAGGNWVPQRDQSNSYTLNDQVTMNRGTLGLTDAFNPPSGNPAVSVMGLLAAGASSGNFAMKDSNNVNITMSLMNISAQQVRLVIEFDETVDSGDSKQPQNFTRVIFLTYNVVTPTGAAAAGNTPPANSPPAKTVSGAGDAGNSSPLPPDDPNTPPSIAPAETAPSATTN